MIKKLLTVLVLTVGLVSINVKAQDLSGLDLAAAEARLGALGDWMASGTGGLMYVSAKAPTTFGIRIGAFAVAAPFPEIEGVETTGYLPNNAGVLVSVGTLGFEATARLLPIDQLNVFAVGLKYDLTSLVPLPGLPISLAAYGDFSKFSVKPDDQTELSVTNIGFGAIASFDFLLNFYARAGFEKGSTSFSYLYDSAKDSNIPAGVPRFTQPISLEPSTSGMRFAAGFTLLMFDFEYGYRTNSYVAAGVSFGI